MKKSLLLCMDLIGFIYTFLPVTLTWISSFYILTSSLPILLKIFVPLYSIFILLSCTFLLRIISPKIKKGVFIIIPNIGYFSWYLNLSLLRAVISSGLYSLILSMSWSRFLFFKSLGANIAYNFQMSLNSELTDLPLITIKENCLLGDHSKITAHYISSEKIIIRPVELNLGTIVLPNTIVKPGTKTNTNEIYPKVKGEN